MRLFPLVLLRSPLGPQSGRFPVETLPLGNSDDLLPGIPRPGLYRGFKAGHPPLQIGEVLLDQLRAHALSMPFRDGPCNSWVSKLGSGQGRLALEKTTPEAYRRTMRNE